MFTSLATVSLAFAPYPGLVFGYREKPPVEAVSDQNGLQRLLLFVLLAASFSAGESGARTALFARFSSHVSR